MGLLRPHGGCCRDHGPPVLSAGPTGRRKRSLRPVLNRTLRRTGCGTDFPEFRGRRKTLGPFRFSHTACGHRLRTQDGPNPCILTYQETRHAPALAQAEYPKPATDFTKNALAPFFLPSPDALCPQDRYKAWNMTNPIAVGLAIVILIALALDFGINAGAGSLFLAREFIQLIHWVAFWR